MADEFNTSVAYLTGQTDNSKPNSYYIKSDTDLELFQLFEKYKNIDKSDQSILLAYLHEFDMHE